MKFLKSKTFLILTVFAFAIITFTACRPKTKVVSPETALQSYLANGDKTYAYTLRKEDTLNHLKVYNLLLTSQQWRQYTWKHTLTIIVPKENLYDGALLFITGGKNKDGLPVKRGHDDEFIRTLAQVAARNKAMVAILWQVPNQPLYDSLTEDALISFTLHNFENDSDYTWPLLFPMVKSAVRAMDAVQEFSMKSLHHKTSRFVVSGGSKRGWTTWLTAAVDNRVAAIAPMSIDVLNMPVNLDYQLKAWNKYSIQIEDYVKLGIPQDVHTNNGSAITTMIDPYSYRKKLTMPKMIIIGTNDEYWPVDAIKNYYDSIPGENFIHYVSNAGHGLGDKKDALNTVSAFFGQTMDKKPYPQCKWSDTEDKKMMSLSVKGTPKELLGIYLWSADSKIRDFRHAKWISKAITGQDKTNILIHVNFPASGFRAFYIDLKYPDPNGGEYTKSTRMFVTDSTGLLTD